MADPQTQKAARRNAGLTFGKSVLVQYKMSEKPAMPSGPIHLGMAPTLNAPSGHSVDEQEAIAKDLVLLTVEQQASWAKATQEPGPLLPGVNRLTAEQWAIAKAHPIVQIYIKEGVLSELKGASADRLPDDEEAAISIVRDTVQEEILRDWSRNEKRKGVLAALDEQLDKLKLEAAKKGE